MIDISVIIPTYNSSDSLVTTLRSLADNDLDRDRFEVIVVDDGSTDATEAAVGAFQATASMTVRYHKRDRRQSSGPGAARNDGLDMARNRVIAMTDADCVVDRGWLSAIERAVIVDGRPLVSGETWCDEVLLFPWKMSPAGQLAVCANLAFDKDRARGVRFAGDIQGVVGDDTDFVIRLSAGERLLRYEPAMRVFHPARHMTLKQVIRRSIWRKNDVLLVKKFGRLAFASMNPFLRPWLFGRISPAALAVAGALSAVIFLAGSPGGLVALFLVAAVGAAAFLAYFYRFCIIYRPAGTEGGVPFRDRLMTLVSTAVYLPCLVWARLVGSWQFRYLLV